MSRPRTSAPKTDKEIHYLGKDLILWATEETKEKRTAFSFWYALKHGMVRKQWKALLKLDIFRPYYETARSSLARKLHNDELEKGLTHRYLRLYDREIADEEDEKARYDAEVKKQSEPEKHFYFYDRDPTKRDGNTDPT
jgi:hypothetical protein